MDTDNELRVNQALKTILMIVLIVLTGLVGAKILTGEYSNSSHIVALAFGAMFASYLILKI